MISSKILYDILEVSSNASDSAIKSSYRRLARKYHPDVNQGDEACIQKFKEITEAYEILSDADKKKNYDILKGFYYNNEAYERRANAANETQAKQAHKAYKDTQREEKKEYKSQFDYKQKAGQNEGFSNIFNDILEGFKSTTSKTQDSKTKQHRAERGNDVNSDISITMSEAIKGTSRTINILHTEKCPNCHGRKFINDTKCPLCKGIGDQSVHKKLNVKIPAGVKHGSKIRIANEGNKGYNGGKNGDLYLNVKIESNAIFKYDGLNVLCSIPITPFEAVLGASINIPTLEGQVSMKIIPNTHSGQKFRLSNQGIKGQNGEHGDMIVTVNIEIPKSLTQREIELYEELKNATKNDIRENLLYGI